MNFEGGSSRGESTIYIRLTKLFSDKVPQNPIPDNNFNIRVDLNSKIHSARKMDLLITDNNCAIKNTNESMELNNLVKSQAATDKVDRLSENKIYSSRESGCCSVWKTMIPTINSALKLSGHPSSPKVMRWFVRTYCKFMENDEGINMDMKSTKFFIKEHNEQDDAPSLSFDNLYSLPQTLLTHMRQFYDFPNKKIDVSANSFSTKTSSFEHLACMISLLQPVITSPNNFMTTYKCDDYLYYHHNDI